MLDEQQLLQSEVVANAAMNRGRGLRGVNSYEKELREDLIQLLGRQVDQHGKASWLDLCCGEGRALLEAAKLLEDQAVLDRVSITGLDLHPPRQRERTAVQFVESSAQAWDAEEEYSLITCVHGLHYIGDKLGLISHMASLLTPDGVLLANLDLADIASPDSKFATSRAAAEFRRAGIDYNRRTKVLRIVGKQRLAFGLRFLGADDQVGPNYTGQPGVRSYYEVDESK